MVVIAVTGATGDCGYEACRQLAFAPKVKHIVITCRAEPQAKAVVAQLASDTGKDASFFSYVLLDLRTYDSIMTAIKLFPSIDRLCLNAGGLGCNQMHLASGATDAMVDNCLGNSVLTEGLLQAGKIKSGGRIVYIGSEVARQVWSFKGLLPDYTDPCVPTAFGEAEIEWAISKNYDWDYGKCVPMRQQLGDYKNAKIVAQQYYAALAKELPAIHVISTSPGAIGDGASFGERGMFPLSQLMKYVPCIFGVIGVTWPLEDGVKRYVDVLTGEPEWESGAMPMSGPNCLPGCLWGAKGPMVDNRQYAPYLRDEALNAKAAAKVREYTAKWATYSVSPQAMERDSAPATAYPVSPVRKRYGKDSLFGERAML